MCRLVARSVAGGLALGMCFPASAHLVSTRFGELYSGFLHPLTSMQHLVPWLGLALLGGLLGARVAKWVLAVFPVAVVAGALAAPGLAAVEQPMAVINLASMMILGLIAAIAPSLPRWSFLTLGAVLGFSHGFANANLGLAGYAQGLYALGVGLASYLLITLALALCDLLVERYRWGRTAARACGSWVLAIGLVFAGFTLIGDGLPL
ncbi:MAG: HupE/UreJ family protein [Pseudomonadota bacterium]